MLTRPAAARTFLAAGLVGTLLAGCGAHAAGPTAGASPGTAAPAAPVPGATVPAGTALPPPGDRPTTSAAPAGAAALTDEQLVGQVFMSYVYGAGASTATAAQRQANMSLYGEATPAEVVRRWHLGGVVLVDHNDLDPQRPTLSTGNVTSAAQVRALTGGLQAVARADAGLPLLIATDQEGGRVQRLRAALPAMSSQQTAAAAGPSVLRCRYAELGRGLAGLGVNQDFAPVADVVRTSTGVIGDRSFGPDPQADAADVTAAVAGLQRSGVLATLKHWPGHGSTSTDSHAALAVVTESAAQWQAVDRVPFAAAGTTVAAVMVGHLAVPALDASGTPATLSRPLVTGQLRDRLGFTGLVVTDSLWMQPVRAAGTPAQVAARALAAGDDLLLESPDLPAAYQALLGQVRADPAVRATVTAAADRVLAAKARVGPGAPGC